MLSENQLNIKIELKVSEGHSTKAILRITDKHTGNCLLPLKTYNKKTIFWLFLPPKKWNKPIISQGTTNLSLKTWDSYLTVRYQDAKQKLIVTKFTVITN